MPIAFSHTQLERFNEFLGRRFGLNFPPQRYHDLEHNLLAACQEFGFSKTDDCLHWMYAEPLRMEQIEILTSHLTVGETYFFREKPIFELLESRILPELIAARRGATRRLRMWSAGCASGEEAYSLAIQACRLLPDLRDWNLTILGTDINVRALRKAVAGSYGDWSFRNAPPWLRSDFMQQAPDGRYQVRPHIRECVTFAYHNLVEDAYPSVGNNTNAMDIILCCNVLMYFQPQTIREIAQKFYNALVDGGWLLVSPGEATASLFPGFERVEFPSAILFRRGAAAEHAVTAKWIRLAEPEPTPREAPAEAACDDLETVIPAPLPTYDEAYAHYREGRYAEAAAALNALTEPRALALKARLYANQGQLTDALSWCEQAINAAKIDPRLHYLRATILQELGCDEEAMQSLKHTLFLDQDFVVAHLAMGNLLLRQGRRNEAKRPFHIALSLLQKQPQDEPLPESEGMTARRLIEVVHATQPEIET